MNAIREFGGVKYQAEWTEFGDRIIGTVRFPSGSVVSYEVCRDGSNLWDHGGTDLRTPEDVAVADRLWPVTTIPEAVQAGMNETAWRQASPEFTTAVWSAAGVDPNGPAPAPVWVPSAADRAETAALCELEGTPLVDARRLGRPARTCNECGSPVYAETCNHCPEC